MTKATALLFICIFNAKPFWVLFFLTNDAILLLGWKAPQLSQVGDRTTGLVFSFFLSGNFWINRDLRLSSPVLQNLKLRFSEDKTPGLPAPCFCSRNLGDYFSLHEARPCSNLTEKPTSNYKMLEHQSPLSIFSGCFISLLFNGYILENHFSSQKLNFPEKNFCWKIPWPWFLLPLLGRFILRQRTLGTNRLWMWWTCRGQRIYCLGNLDILRLHYNGCCPTGFYDYILCIIQV